MGVYPEAFSRGPQVPYHPPCKSTPYPLLLLLETVPKPKSPSKHDAIPRTSIAAANLTYEKVRRFSLLLGGWARVADSSFEAGVRRGLINPRPAPFLPIRRLIFKSASLNGSSQLQAAGCGDAAAASEPAANGICVPATGNPPVRPADSISREQGARGARGRRPDTIAF